MTTTTTPAASDRVAALPWPGLRHELDERGFAVTPPLLDAAECDALAALFDDGRFRATVDMARHRFGDGRYRYFDHPLPPLVAALRPGDVFFPLPALTVLSDAGEIFDGGEFVLVEQRPRAQSRAHVVRPTRGAFVLFPTHHRPHAGARGHHRVVLRHGVSTVTRGSRTALGIPFHDAR